MNEIELTDDRVVRPALASSNTAPLPLRMALSCYPQRWQERYAREMADTFDDLYGSSPPSRRVMLEIASLAISGLTQRAKTSLIFWCGMIVIVVMMAFAANDYTGRQFFITERYWPSILTRPAIGFLFALPLSAFVASLRASIHYRSAGTAGLRFARACRDIVAIAAFVGLGYWITVGIFIWRSGVPLAGIPAMQIPAAYTAMTLASVVFGYALGCSIPLVAAAPVALVGSLIWQTSPWWDGGELGWRNITGYNLAGSAYDVYRVPIPESVLVVIVLHSLLTSAALFVVVWSTSRKRLAVLILVSALSAHSLTGISPTLLAYVGDGWDAVRNSSDLLCRGTAPEICLMPEQEADDGEYVRTTVLDAVSLWTAAGYTAPQRIESTSIATGEIWRQKPGIWKLGWSGDSTADVVRHALASSAAFDVRCSLDTDELIEQQDAAIYSAGLILGGSLDAFVPTYSVTDATGTTDFTDDEVRDRMDVHDLSEARVFMDEWYLTANSC